MTEFFPKHESPFYVIQVNSSNLVVGKEDHEIPINVDQVRPCYNRADYSGFIFSHPIVPPFGQHASSSSGGSFGSLNENASRVKSSRRWQQIKEVPGLQRPLHSQYVDLNCPLVCPRERNHRIRRLRSSFSVVSENTLSWLPNWPHSTRTLFKDEDGAAMPTELLSSTCSPVSWSFQIVPTEIAKPFSRIHQQSASAVGINYQRNH